MNQYTLPDFINKVNQYPEFDFNSPYPTHFMFSYDMPTAQAEKYYAGTFRQFMIAALISRGAVNLQSFVESTITFTADSDEDPLITFQKWKNFLELQFSSNLKFQLGMLSENTLGFPLVITHNTTDHAINFTTERDGVISKF